MWREKWAKDINYQFTENDIQMASKHENIFSLTHKGNANLNYTEIFLCLFFQISDWKILKPGCGQKDVLVIVGKLV